MSRTLPEPLGIHFRIEKGPRSLNLHNSNSTACKFKFPLPSAAADSNPEAKWAVPRKHSSKQRVKTETLVVRSEFGDLQEKDISGIWKS